MPQLKPIQRREEMRIGRKKVAEIITHKNGHRVVVVHRTMRDVLRGKGNAFISHAMQDGSACWSVETHILSRMKALGLELIAVKVRASGALYLTTLSRFIEDSKVLTTRKRNGSIQRSLPLTAFSERRGVVKL